MSTFVYKLWSPLIRPEFFQLILFFFLGQLIAQFLFLNISENILSTFFKINSQKTLYYS